MPKRTILKSLYRFFTIPIYYVGRTILWTNLFNLRMNLLKCTKVVDSEADKIPEQFIEYLISAEDHRSLLHYGIDHIGIVRAIYKKISKNETQGASTIEQQFVRVVTGNYSKTLARKLTEQILATLLLKNRKKSDIAKAYLAIAYYGHRHQGIDGIQKLIGSNIDQPSEEQIISIIARLKYPEPSTDKEMWNKKINNRINYIKSRQQQLNLAP
jgi:monofunctional glycosyltransferase